MVKSLIDPKKKAEVRDALRRGDFAKILGKKKELAKPAPIVEKPASKEDPKIVGVVEKIPEDFFSAARDGDLEQIKRITKKYGSWTPKDIDGNTALMNAASSGHTEIVKLLIDTGMDVDENNGRGFTALINAASGGHKEIVQLLIDAGADVNLKDYNRWTPLMHALANEHWEIAEILTLHGAT